MLPLDDARAYVLDRCEPLPRRRVPIDEALGASIAEDVVAGEPVPPFANTAMDGYAVRTEDVRHAPVRLVVAGTLAAGHAPERELRPGEAIRIMTGAPIPPGADAVVMVELTTPVDDGRLVEIAESVPVGNHIRPAGDDIVAGQLVFRPRDVVTPGALGVLATVGRTHVEIVRPARVGVLSTGDELIEGDAPLAPGQIRDSNRHSLLALLAQAGCEPVDLGLARDDESVITGAIERGLETCDALVTSGGVSVGDFDYVKAVLDRLGDMRWMQVAIRPAKPLAFGVVRGKPVFGLPGNPVSSMVSFELFARPALRQMMHHRSIDRPVVAAISDDGLQRRSDGKIHFARVVVSADHEGVLHARSAGGQGSHQLAAMAVANGLAVLPDGDGVAAGGTTQVMLIGDIASSLF